MPLFDDDYVVVGDKEWVGIDEAELAKYTPELRSIIRLFEAKLKERNT
jgi:siderophore synthetase component